MIVSIPVDKVRADEERTTNDAGVVDAFQSPWIRFAFRQARWERNLISVSIPVDKVRADTEDLPENVPQACFNPRG